MTIKTRLNALEAMNGGNTATVVLPMGLTECGKANFIASEKKRLGLGPNDKLQLIKTGVSRTSDANWKLPSEVDHAGD